MKVLEIHRIRFGAFEFDRLNGLLYRDGAELSLPPRAVSVLACLLDRPGQVVSKQVLLDEVWKDANVTETSLTEAVSLLRQVLIDDPQRPTFIQTIPRRGYRFLTPDAAPTSPIVSSPIVPSPNVSAAPLASEALAAAIPDEPAWPAWLPWMFLAIAVAVLSGIVIALMNQPSTYSRPVVRFAVGLPTGLDLAASDGPSIALSRNGQRLAFVARRAADGIPRLYVRDMDRLDAILLEGTEGAAAPFFSPDGRWIGFFAGDALNKVPTSGGTILKLCDARAPFGAVWSTRRGIIFAGSPTGGLARVAEEGGTPAPLTSPDAEEGEVRHAWPDLLPDDSGVLFTGVPLAGGPEASRIAALSFETGRIQTLVDAGMAPHYAQTGHLLFARDRAIVAAPFDPDALELLGPAVPVLDNVATRDAIGAAQFALAAAGHAAAVRVTRPETTATYRWIAIDDRGDDQRAPANAPTVTAPFPAREVRGIALSPDGTRLAVSLGDGHRTDIWVSDLARGDLQRLTHDGQNVAPVWAANGRRVYYAARRDGGPFGLSSRALDDGAASGMTANGTPTHHLVPASAAPDGLVYVDVDPKTGLDLWFMPGDDAGPRPLVETSFDEAFGVISPDGRWIAYQSNASGSWSVMLRARAARDANAVRIAASDGSQVAWSPDGRHLLFTHEGRLLLATPQLSDTPSLPAPPRVLAADIDPTGGFGVAADGRVLVRRRDAASSLDQLEVVLDWSRELSAKVPIRPRTPKPVR